MAWRISGWQRSRVFYGSYGLNEWAPMLSDSLLHFAAWPGLTRANAPVLLDCVWVGGQPPPSSNPPKEEDALGSFPGDMTWFCIDRHSGRINSLFMDWSVRKVGLKELWLLDWQPDFPVFSRWTKARGIKPKDWPQWMRRFPDY
jgi:prepilin-type processing-associated H-X9-DG protein